MKLVGTIHASVHHIIHGQEGFLSGLDGRRTDDSSGRSTALYQLNLGLTQDCQGLIPDVV